MTSEHCHNDSQGSCHGCVSLQEGQDKVKVNRRGSEEQGSSVGCQSGVIGNKAQGTEGNGSGGKDQSALGMGHCRRGSGGMGLRIKVRGQRLGMGQGVRTGSRVLRTRARGQGPGGRGFRGQVF